MPAMSRIERLRKARNVNEVARVLKEIAKSVGALKIKATKLITSLSKAHHTNKSLSAKTTEFEITRDGSNITFTNNDSRTAPGGAVKLKLERFSKPPTKQIVQHNDVLSEMFDNLQQLKEAISLLEQSFVGAKHQNAALKAAKLLYAEVDDKISEAFGAIDDLAQKHMPAEMTKVGESIVKYIVRSLDSSRYSDLHTYCHVANGAGGDLLFSFYIVFENLKSDSGFVFDKYYIVLTGRIIEGSLSLYLNSIPDFRLPGKYPIGQVLSSTNIRIISRHIDEFMSQNDVSLELERQALPLTQQRADTSGMATVAGVERLKVSDDSLIVVLKGNPSGEALTNIVVPIMSRLHGLIGNRKRNSKIQYKKFKIGSKNALEFVLVNALGTSKKLNKSTLHDLQAMLELTNKQVEYIKEAQRSVDD